jgi:hypothetical protein
MQQNSPLFKRVILLSFVLLVGFSSTAQSVWNEVSESEIPLSNERYTIPAAYKSYAIDNEVLNSILSSAPKEFSVEVYKSNTVVELPMPSGEMQKFAVVESSIMPKKLADKFSGITSYLAQGIDDKTATARFTLSKKGFHAMIISVSGTTYIDPYSLNNTEYCISYFKEDFYATNKKYRDAECVVNNAEAVAQSKAMTSGQSGDVLRVYRAAIACTGEYAQFHAGESGLEASEAAMAAIVTTLDRVNLVYDREASFRLNLVENNDLIIYTDSESDPYANFNAGAILGQNQNNIDDLIGNDNYDIGHVFSTGAGGLASPGVCDGNFKAQGVTGTNAPIGDAFDIDYVCHEMGHQFGANHTFNGDTNANSNCNEANRNAATAYEPGSGTTILAYAGICAVNNLQQNSDDYYHTASFDEMTAHMNGEGWANDCADQVVTGNNIPVANAGDGGYTIPANTPFELTGSGNDIDAGDELTYCWEQYDLGPIADDLSNPSGNAPLFRSWPPTTSTTRIFPRLEDLLAGTSTLGEILPDYSRDLTFRLTVRDNHAGSGGVSYDQIHFDVTDEAGPFAVNNITQSWEYGVTYTVNWSVANTNVAPVSCETVDIYLSTDGGNTFDELLAENVPNNGVAEIICPNVISTQARIKVKGVNNVFFNISNVFEITESSIPNFVVTVEPEEIDICSQENQMAEFNVQIDPLVGFSEQVTLSVVDADDYPGISINFDPTTVTPGENSVLTISAPIPIPAGNYPFQVQAVSDDIVHLEDVEINVYSGVPAIPELNYPTDELEEVTLTPTFTWSDNEAASEYTLQVATDSLFTENVQEFESITESQYLLDVLLAANTEYYWNVVAHSPCGESEPSDTLSFITGEEGVTDIPGCTDPTAFNYNEAATIDDGTCEPFIFGCTNPIAENYNEEANTENGSCVIPGCTNEIAMNYDPVATEDDGSCIIAGCTDPEAYNFDEDANYDDGSCVPYIEGCTDEEAYNYNPSANLEDGSCDYTSLVIIQYEELEGSNFHFWTIINEISSVGHMNWDMGDGTTYTAVDEPTHYYEENGVYEVSVNVYTSTGVYIAYETIEVTGVHGGCTDELAYNFDPLATFDDGSCIEAVYGCTSEDALNYNAEANTDDGSCIGVVYGCMDENAMNYNAEANISDDSCEYEVLGCTDADALNYNELANTDDGSCTYPLDTTPSWPVDLTSNNHIILVPSTANITINDAPIEMGDYIGVFYMGLDDEYHCAGKMMWTGVTNTLTVYGADPNEFNGMANGEQFVWMTWKLTTNEVRMALADYDLSMPNTDTYAVDGISGLTALSNTMLHQIDMVEGWNLISTNVVPDYPDMGDVLAPIVDDIYLAKDEFGLVYWPEYNLNNIGDHTVGKAYKVKMNNASMLEVRGANVNPADYPLTLNEGWSYLGYLRNSPADADAVLDEIKEDVTLIKDGVGNVYWPEYGVNTIGNMEPGQGYQIRMSSDRIFTYPSNDIVLPEARNYQKLSNVYYPKSGVKEGSMTLALPEYLIEDYVSIGDEFAVKNSLGEIVGSEVYNGGTMVLTVWISELDLNSQVELFHWSESKAEEQAVALGSAIQLENDAIVVAEQISFSTNNSDLFTVYPNPVKSEATVRLNTEEGQDVRLSIFNVLGEEVKLILSGATSENNESIVVNVDELVSGVYFLRLQTENDSQVELLQITK